MERKDTEELNKKRAAIKAKLLAQQDLQMQKSLKCEVGDKEEEEEEEDDIIFGNENEEENDFKNIEKKLDGKDIDNFDDDGLIDDVEQSDYEEDDQQRGLFSVLKPVFVPKEARETRDKQLVNINFEILNIDYKKKKFK